MDRIYLSPPHMSGEELKHVRDVFESNWIAPVGPKINLFEKNLSEYFQGWNVVALSSGTAAIHLALDVLGVSLGDEVICSSFTFAGSCFPVAYLGGRPVFVDSEPESWNMDADFLEEAIKDGIKRNKRPKAIILVHLYGTPAAHVRRIVEISKNYSIPLIEDAAEAAGSEVDGKKVGTLGDIGILSFNGNKIITTSGGGALLTQKKEISDKIGYLSSQAKSDKPYYHHEQLGYNYRMSNIVAGVGVGQLKILDQRVASRRRIFENYLKSFKEIENITTQQESQNHLSNRWLSAFDFQRGVRFRDHLIKLLEEHNIESRPLWKPMHAQPIFEDCRYWGDGVSDRLFNSGLCLPSGSSLTLGEQKRVTDIIKNKIS